jgi:hypothetical protein
VPKTVKKTIRTSDFIRSFGFTGGAWLTLLGPWRTPPSKMDGKNFRLRTISESFGFFHPDISSKFSDYLPWWEPIFQTRDGVLLEPYAFVLTTNGYAMKVIKNRREPEWTYEEYLLADLLGRGIRPVFHRKVHGRLVLARESKVFVRA